MREEEVSSTVEGEGRRRIERGCLFRSSTADGKVVIIENDDPQENWIEGARHAKLDIYTYKM